MESAVTFNPFVRRPFPVEAEVITAENIDAFAKLLGELKEKDGEKHILLDRRIIPQIKRAYIGWYVTKLDENYRCYSPKVFDREFVAMDEGWSCYFDQVVAAETTYGLTVATPTQVGEFGRIEQAEDLDPALV